MNNKNKILMSLFLILTITSITFLPSLNNGFTNWDDDKYITQNPMIKSLSSNNIKRMFTTTYENLYQPLTLLSYAIEYHFFKLNPFYYHLINLVLHLFNSLLIFWMILLLSNKVLIAFCASILFGIHPLHVESVAWITERKDVLYSFFFLGSIICYLYYRKKQINSSLTPRNDIFYYLSLFLFVLSLLAKPMAVTLPFVLVICDYLIKPNKLGRRSRRGNEDLSELSRRDNYNFLNLKEKIPFFILSFVFIAITIFGVSKAQALRQTPVIPFFYYIFTSSYGFVFYLTKTVLPVKLSCFYPYPDNIDKILPFSFIISPVIIIILTVVVILSKKFTKKIVFASLFFLITILPVIQLIPSSKTITADRYVYIPLIGLFYIFAEGFLWLYNKNKQKILKISLLTILVSVIAILSILTWQRSKVWENSITLWSDVLKNYPNLALAYNSRGIAYSYIEEYDKAIADYNQALKINPKYIDVYNSRGIAYRHIKEYDKAIADYNQALKINPKYIDVYNNRGIAYGSKGDLDKAISDFTHVLRITPNDAEIYNNRGIAYSKKGEYTKAFEDVKKSQGLGFKVDSQFLEYLLKHSKK